MPAPKKRAPTISMGKVPNLTLEMPLDDQRIQQIQSCLAKGHLSIKLSQVDLAAGRLGDAWAYD